MTFDLRARPLSSYMSAPVTALGVSVVSLGAALHATNYLAKQIYPVTSFMGMTFVNGREYRELSTARRVISAALLVLSGALIGAAIGGALTLGAAAVFSHYLSLEIGLICGVVFGGFGGLLSDPSLGPSR
jgi:hypothetical protein